ncbi:MULTISPECIES: hypothetical protein [unclassified Saccharothrix]|uniref:hypothetical protein n=1 Tax=unclassified Saccharothrix TaxID=2593673 RepID=UPI00307DBEF7
MRGGVLLVVAALLVAGCAKKVDVASDGGASVTVPPPLETATPTGPTFVPPNGTCTVRVEAPPPAPETTPPPSTTARREPPGDMPPNHADNRSWRVRKPLSPANHARGMAILDRIRPGITGLCDTGNFSPDSARTVLAAAGAPKAWVSGLKVGYGQVPPPGVYFYEVSEDPTLGTVCVLGDLRPGEPGQPGRVAFTVSGPIRDGGCDEPLSH